jgi:hypothetical protein
MAKLTEVTTPRGKIYFDQSEEGRLHYGSTVEKHKTYYGYKLDYYEKPTYPYIWEVEIAQMWNYVFENETDEGLLKKGIVLMEVNATETTDFHIMFSTKAIDNLYKEIMRLCGVEEGIPVSSVQRKNELEFYGKKSIIVSETIEKILERKFGSFETIKRNALNTAYKPVDVDVERQEILNQVVDQIHETYSFATRDRIQLCEFLNNDIYGLHGTEDGIIYLNHKTINDIKELWITLAHEFAHDFGEDGSKAHLDAVQIILTECLINKGEQ